MPTASPLASNLLERIKYKLKSNSIMNSFYNLKVFRQIAFAAFAFACNCASAQDLIVKKDGTVIQAKVTKIGTSEVEYKKWSNQDGPQYSIAVADILAINYMNGEKEMFDNVSTNGNGKQSTASEQQTSTTPKEETAIPSPDNKELLNSYNNQVVVPIKKNIKDRQANTIIPVYGLTSNSIMSDDKITLAFGRVYNMLWGGEVNKKYSELIGYKIQVYNKTDENVYIDLANSFKIDDKGNSVPYYSNKTYATNTSSVSGGLYWGVVAGNTMVSETPERFLTVPPHGKVILPLEKQAVKKGFENVYESFIPSVIPPMDLKVNEYKDLCTEQNTTSIYRRIITYSNDPNFSTYKKLNIGIFLKGAMGDFQSQFSYQYENKVNEKVLGSTNWIHLILGEKVHRKTK